MHIKRIHLNAFLKSDFMDRFLEIYGLSPKYDYPFLSRDLKQYKRRLSSLPRLSGLLNFGEISYQDIHIDEDNFYQVAWSIPVAKRIIRKYDPPLLEFQLKEMAPLVDKKGINQRHLDVALRNSAPIILALYPLLVTVNKLLIIDGNHRVTAKEKDGQIKIPGYLLEPQHHMKAMIGEVDRTLYKIHSNYYHIACYMGGLINEQKLKEGLFPL